MTNDTKPDIKMEVSEGEIKECDNSKELGDNLEDIKKFIEEEEMPELSTASKDDEVATEENVDVDGKDFDERLAVASSMMDMIINDSEERLSRKKDSKSPSKNNLNEGDKGVNNYNIYQIKQMRIYLLKIIR
jgi:hypothetical protein